MSDNFENDYPSQFHIREFNPNDGRWYTVSVTGSKDEARQFWKQKWDDGSPGLQMLELVVQVTKIREEKRQKSPNE